MNLPQGSIKTWDDLCKQFVANFESSYACPCSETDLLAVKQRRGESLRSFTQRFSQVRNTIPRISASAIILAFRQGVRDKKMLEKLNTRDVEDVGELFSLADKCAKAAEGRAWHEQPAPVDGHVSEHSSDTVGLGGVRKKK